MNKLVTSNDIKNYLSYKIEKCTNSINEMKKHQIFDNRLSDTKVKLKCYTDILAEIL